MHLKSLTTAVLLAALLVPSSVLGAPVPGSSDAELEERIVSSRLRNIGQWGAPTTYVKNFKREPFKVMKSPGQTGIRPSALLRKPTPFYTPLLGKRDDDLTAVQDAVERREPFILNQGVKSPFAKFVLNRDLGDLDVREPRRGGGRGGRRARRSFVDEEQQQMGKTTRATQQQQLELATREPAATRQQELDALTKYFSNRKPIIRRLRNKRSLAEDGDEQLEIREPVNRAVRHRPGVHVALAVA